MHPSQMMTLKVNPQHCIVRIAVIKTVLTFRPRRPPNTSAGFCQVVIIEMSHLLDNKRLFGE
jgi:hypothetical protein